MTALRILAWPSACVIVSVIVIARFGKPVRNWLGAKAASLAAIADQRQIAFREHQEAIELDHLTIQERAELRKAELRLKTAEIDSDLGNVKVLNDDHLAAERQILAVRTQRRLELVKEEPVNKMPNPETSELLGKGYRAFIAEARDDQCRITFRQWVGDLALLELDPETAKPLIDSYRSHMKVRYFPARPPYLGEWVGLTVRDSQLVEKSG